MSPGTLPPVASWIDLLVGVALVDETVKALHCLVAFSSAACFLAYVWPVFRDAGKSPLTARFLGWSLLFSGSQSIAFVPLLVSYLLYHTDPVSVPGLADEWRLLSLVTLHTGLVGRWAEAEPERFSVRLVEACLLSFAGTVAVFMLLPYRG